jgi:hypothetical protein
MSRLDDSEPKMQIPETWASKMACPVCGSRPLGVFHPTGHADRFVCQSCETSFELENNGTRVRFITLPQGVTPWLRGTWVSLEEALSAFASHQNDTLAARPPDSQPAISHPVADQPAITPPVAAQPAEPIESVPPEPVKEPVSNSVESVATTAENPPAEIPETKSAEPESAAESIIPIVETTGQPDVLPQNTSQNPPFMATVLPANPPAGDALKPPASPSPFYKDDIDVPGIYPDRIRSEMEKPAVEVWKNLEDERVKNLIMNSRAQESAPSFPQNGFQTVQQVIQPEIQDGAGSRSDFEKPVDRIESQPSNQNVEERIDLNNPPPTRPVVDTPSGAISEQRTIPRSKIPAEDLGALRTQISNQSILPTLNEKMQAASQRALELQRLGNTENEVRSILERSSGLTPEEVVEVIRSLDKPEERKRSSRILLIFFAVAIVVFAVLAWLFFSNITREAPANEQPGSAVTESAGGLPGEVISAESLPAPLQTLIPNGVRIFNDPPSVEISSASAIPPTSCPKSKIEAATLFGGPAENWNASDQNRGWVLVTQQQSLVIKIPANMTAGYLVFEKGPEMRSVPGPAIVRNIYMISISCQ